jgi:hypothetical protein
MRESIEDVILKEGIGGIIILTALNGKTGVLQALNMRNLRFLIGLTTHILLHDIEDSLLRIAETILTLHLPFRRLPGRLVCIAIGTLYDNKAGDIERDTGLVNETDRAEVNTPPFLRMLYIEVALVRSIREASGATDQAGLENIVHGGAIGYDGRHRSGSCLSFFL